MKPCHTLFLILMAWAMACTGGNAAVMPVQKRIIRSVNLGKTSYLVLLDVARFYGFRIKVDGKNRTYFSKFSTLELAIDSRNATLNGTSFSLAFPVRLSKFKTPLISQNDFQNYLEPLLRPHAMPRKTVSRIVIDPGHGGKDPGCHGGNVNEKKITLDVGLKLASILNQKGYAVAMTRMKDKDLTLKQRTDLAMTFKPDLFISLHCNSASPAASGIEVFCATPQHTPSFGGTALFTTACEGNRHNPHNAYIAFHTQKELVQAMKVPDRGVKHKRFNVIAKTDAPAILIELGFLSNAQDRKMLTATTSQTKLANAIAKAIDTFKNATAPKRKRG